MSLDQPLGGERSDVRDQKLDVSGVHEGEEFGGVGLEFLGGEDEVVEAGRSKEGEKRRVRRSEKMWAKGLGGKRRKRQNETNVGRVICEIWD